MDDYEVQIFFYDEMAIIVPRKYQCTTVPKSFLLQFEANALKRCKSLRKRRKKTNVKRLM